MAEKKTKFGAPAPDVEKKMQQIEEGVEGSTTVKAKPSVSKPKPVAKPKPQPEQLKKPLPAELVSGDVTSQQAFTVRIEKDLKERLTFLVMLMKRTGDKNITVASTVEEALRGAVNAKLEELGYDS